MNLTKQHVDYLNILISAARHAQSKGVYTLEEAERISVSVRNISDFFNEYIESMSAQPEEEEKNS